MQEFRNCGVDLIHAKFIKRRKECADNYIINSMWQTIYDDRDCIVWLFATDADFGRTLVQLTQRGNFFFNKLRYTNKILGDVQYCQYDLKYKRKFFK